MYYEYFMLAFSTYSTHVLFFGGVFFFNVGQSVFYVFVFAATLIGFCSYDSNKITPIKSPMDSRL